MLTIFSHRGIELSKKKYIESTYRSFSAQIKNGLSLEFDVNFTKDNKIIIFHDRNLARLTHNKDQRLISDLTLREIKKSFSSNNKILTLKEIIDLIRRGSPSLYALHLKSQFHHKHYLELLVRDLQKYRKYLDRLLIFDIPLTTAQYLKKNLKGIHLAPSVSHPFDIQRYNQFTGGTLIPVSGLSAYAKVCDWVWLDEWDTSDKNNTKKNLYSKKNFDLLRKKGFKIAVISPELHSTSPGLLGGEKHPDGLNRSVVSARLLNILKLKPDAICSDYGLLCRNIWKKLQ